MAIECTELVTSRNLKEGRRQGLLERQLTRIYRITGTDDPATWEALGVGPQMGEQYDNGDETQFNLYVISREYEVLKVAVAEDESDGVLRMTATYGPAEKIPSQEQPQDQFETNIGTQNAHVERSIETQDHYPSSASGVGDMIGVNGDRVDGVDIEAPQIEESQTRYRTSLDTSYKLAVAALVGKTNADAFNGWAAGTVLFKGMRASKSGTGKWTCVYTFAISLDSTESITTESGAQNVSKGGWQYMWFEKSKKKASATNTVEIGIEAVHVATVYESGDFDALEIG